jgi:predicted nucleotidyltransferase
MNRSAIVFLDEKGMNELRKSVCEMTWRIAEILSDCAPSVYLYGSVTLEDFRPGWSDIDILVLTKTPISEEQAQKLVHLRQTLLLEEPGNPHYRAFEGGMLSLDAFLRQTPDTVVYWGTSGERITSRYQFDSFSRSALLDSGILLFGEDVRGMLCRPAFDDLKNDVRRHYESIRQHAQRTGRDLYSYGWLLDIARCLYTLRTGKIIPKTAAGEWALRESICPCVEALARAVEVRRKPMKYMQDPSVMDYAETLGESVQRFADVLERELQGVSA